MSRFSYIQSRLIASEDPSFDALIMAAMRKADSYNATRLRAAFPTVWIELQARHDAPGGYLLGEEIPVGEEGR